MKAVLVFILCLFIMSISVSADVIDKPVATVKLNRLEAITVKQFRQKVETLESRAQNSLTLDDRKKLLDMLIADILIKQVTEKEGIAATQQ